MLNLYMESHFVSGQHKKVKEYIVNFNSENKVMNIEKINKIGREIDAANNKEDNNKLLSLSKECKKILQKEKLAVICYFLANCYNGLRIIKHKYDVNNIWRVEQKELFKEIYYLRQAILTDDFNSIDVQYKMGVFTNLGNAFNHYGRPIIALSYFNRALNLRQRNINFAMALVNKAKCLESYAKLNYDWSYKKIILKYAHSDYKKGCKYLEKYINSNDNMDFYQNIKIKVSKTIEEIERHLTTEWIKKHIDLNDYQLRKYKNERNYRYWVLDNKLFLNSMNDLGSFNTSTHDPLNLPNLTVNIDSGFPKYITYFNQIKQEYASCRVLLYEGIHELTQKFYDKELLIIDDYDYNLYNIHIEKIKLSFRGFYSLLDKIANFINEYFSMGQPENKVSFRTIFNKQKLNNFKNLALRGLYLISKDLYPAEDEESEKFMQTLEPEAKEINKIRNYLEHKFIAVKILEYKKYTIAHDRERSFSIMQDNLKNKTIKLAKLIREVIIYLSFAVHIEENNKENNNNKKPVMPINTEIYKF